MANINCHRGLLLAAALCGFTGVLAGAFGAHALKDHLGEHLAAYHTGVLYHLVHAVALLGAAVLAGGESSPRSRITAAAGWFMLAGVTVFSGSLYLITPIGGVSFLVGWTLLMITAWRMR
jgi:uncharacterized membrane protein YgdD (TMEM256/DUF423 family)